jgi:transposase InsO family protein
MRFAFIQEQQNLHEVRQLCELMEVSVSGYYAWRQRKALGEESARTRRDRELTVHIRAAFVQQKRRAGSPRIHRELKANDIHVSRKRVARLMRQEGLRAKSNSFRPQTTNSKHSRPVADNVLERRFDPAQWSGLNQAWAGDITYLPTSEGWSYLAVLMDLHSRRIIGWALDDHMEERLVSRALEMALQYRKPEEGLIHHSDRGSQYASNGYQSAIDEAGLLPSMSRKGNCWDNAVLESFFATLKKELIYREDYNSREEAQREVFEYIEVYYNRQRRHSALGYLAPVEYEQRIATAQ